MSKVVASALGIISPLGSSIPEFQKNLFSGKSAVASASSQMNATGMPVQVAAFIPKSFSFPERDLNLITEEYKIMISDLMNQVCAQLDSSQPFDAVMLGINPAISDWPETIFAHLDQFEKIPSLRDWNFLSTINESLKKFNFPTLKAHQIVSLFNTCVTGNVCIGQAFHKIRAGEWNRVLVLNLEQRIRPWTVWPLHLLGALTPNTSPENASCPFSRDRSGFVKAEGAAALVLEKLSSQTKNSWGQVIGFSHTNDAWRLTDGRDDLIGSTQAIEDALKDAHLIPEKVQYINAHGSSTILNDPIETGAIKKALGAHAYKVPISSLKSQMGHANIACGSIEAIATLLMLKNQTIAPTINYKNSDPACDLDYVPNQARKINLRYALSNSFGFGGANSILALQAMDEDCK